MSDQANPWSDITNSWADVHNVHCIHVVYADIAVILRVKIQMGIHVVCAGIPPEQNSTKSKCMAPTEHHCVWYTSSHHRTSCQSFTNCCLAQTLHFAQTSNRRLRNGWGIPPPTPLKETLIIYLHLCTSHERKYPQLKLTLDWTGD